MRPAELDLGSLRVTPRLHRRFAALERLSTLRRADPGLEVHGTVAQGFEPVLEAFAGNFRQHGEIGAACAVWYRGEKVVDLWGGLRAARARLGWGNSTPVSLRSMGGMLSAFCAALAHSRGLLRYDTPVAQWWPQFAQGGKGGVTVRQLLSHQAGLCALDVPLTTGLLGDREALAAALAQQRPYWKAGSRHGYHAVTLDLYFGELLRRCDPLGRGLAQFFAEEITRPLGLQVELPGAADSGVAASQSSAAAWLDRLETMGPAFVLASACPRSLTRRAFGPGWLEISALDHPLVRSALPGFHATARGLARLYGVFANQGDELGLRAETIAQLQLAPAFPWMGRRDVVLRREMAYSLGFWKSPARGMPAIGDSGYGIPMDGGGLAYADPDARLGFCYLPNRVGPHFGGDPRADALIGSLYPCLDVQSPKERLP